jgi:uncharacterized OB-fold protein
VKLPGMEEEPLKPREPSEPRIATMDARQAQPWVCRHCGKAAHPASRFCTNCGASRE